MRLTFYLYLASLITLIGCSDDGESTKVNIKFNNTTASLGLAPSFIQPDVMRIRPIAVRISETNEGGYMVWGSKNCAGEKGKVKIDDKNYEFFSEHLCTANEDDDWLELTAGAEAVNAELNSQSFPIPPGNYAWVSLIICGPNDNRDASTVRTYEYQAGVMTEPNYSTNCSPIGNYTALETPISITEGGSITVSINYNLARMVTADVPVRDDGTATPWNTDWAGNGGQCKYVPNEDETELQVMYCLGGPDADPITMSIAE